MRDSISNKIFYHQQILLRIFASDAWIGNKTSTPVLQQKFFITTKFEIESFTDKIMMWICFEVSKFPSLLKLM